MNIYLLELVGKWFSIAFVSIISLFDVNVYQEQSMKVELSVKGEEEINVVNSQVEVPTIVNSDVQIEETQQVEQTITEVSSVVEQQPIVAEQPQVEETQYEEYIGKVTGYGPDCYGCSGRGNLACKTKDGSVHNLYDNGIYYNDDTFGSVRIVAAAQAKFPCGTIIEIVKDGTSPITTIVLDRGGDMNRAWTNEQLVWLDLAYDSTASSKLGTISGSNIKFVVKRWGW